jgi:hypothetical protein
MRISSKQTAVLALLFITAAMARAGEIVDRIVANVNSHAILQSDWDSELGFEALLNGKSVDSFSLAERKAALDRLIDQELLREQVKPSTAASSDTVRARISEVRKLYPEANSDDGWRKVMARYGFTEALLQKRMGDDILLMQLVEEHLRPSIQIDSNAVESYYQEHLLPELRRNGNQEVSLPEVSNRIKDLLAEQKMNELIAGWLQSLRSESSISKPDEGEQNR